MNIQEVTQMLKEADKVGHTLLIESLHGIGKSSICKQYADENNLHFEPLILSLMDVGDLLGIPRTTEIGGQITTVWAAPDWYSRIVNAAWPVALKASRLEFTDEDLEAKVKTKVKTSRTITRKDLNTLYCNHFNMPDDELQLLRQNSVRYLDSKRSVLFLDEFNRTQSDILNASLQLVLEKQLHSHKLPVVNGKETFIVSAINPADGDYTVSSFDPALLDRFVHCSLDPDAKTWLSWAKANNVNPVVIDYISQNRKNLHYMDKNGGKGASNRSWTRAAAYLDSINNTPTDVTSYYLRGIIGQSLAAEFLMFLNGYAKSISIEELEVMVTKESKKFANIEALGDRIAELTKDLEPIKRTELSEELIAKYRTETDPVIGKPYLAMLYSLPVEILASLLSKLKAEDLEGLTNLAAMDKTENNKALLCRLTGKAV